MGSTIDVGSGVGKKSEKGSDIEAPIEDLNLAGLPALCMSLILSLISSGSKGSLRAANRGLMGCVEGHAREMRGIKARAKLRPQRSLAAQKEMRTGIQGASEEELRLPGGLMERCGQLRVLDLRGLNLKSLQGCPDHLTKLTTRGLRPSRYERTSFDLIPLSDLSPLSLISGLKELDVSFSDVSDLSALSSCKSLTKLLLRHTLVADLSPLSSHILLRKLDISSCVRIGSIQPISSLTSLVSISADFLPLTSIEPLGKCTHLQKISLFSSSASCIQPLESCKCLEAVDLGQISAADLSPLLPSSSSLVKLRIDGMRNLEDVRILVQFTSLRLLDISYSEVEVFGEDDGVAMEGAELAEAELEARLNEIELLVSQLKALTHLSMSGEASEAMSKALNVKVAGNGEVFEDAFAASDVEAD